MKFTLTFFFIIFTYHSFSQVKYKDYVSLITDDYILYFIDEINSFKSIKYKKERFTFDITYKSNDSFAVVKFTLITRGSFSLDSLIFLKADSIQFTSSHLNKIYVEYDNEYRIYRYFFEIPFETLRHFFDYVDSKNLVIKICDSNNIDNNCKSFSPKNKRKWIKQSKMLTNMFNLIIDNN